ncbi:hypothetical protein [Sphingomonas sp. BAUL-RG-20F-R05-02]|uniref:hypothetical protein n=1 Tax=Sphingomonas sp. BAUL-RG-20F-R05-02 TaxID=2914830 RepID=UPI001F58651B|nr:hypothetical protein [Sphingomonas sp. BAUL-RG-20F-R05-02]
MCAENRFDDGRALRIGSRGACGQRQRYLHPEQLPHHWHHQDRSDSQLHHDTFGHHPILWRVDYGYLGDTVAKTSSFTDTFNFVLPAKGVGGVVVTLVVGSFKGVTNLDFTSVLVNGATALISKILNGIVKIAPVTGVSLSAGANSIFVSGISRGNGSRGGSIAFTPSVTEIAT